MARQSILLLSGRTPWSTRVTGWADLFDVYRCSSAEEARALLTGSRPWAAALIDGADHAADRDLIGLAARSGALPVVVDSPRSVIDWRGLGAHATLLPDFGPEELISALDADTSTQPVAPAAGPLVCVTGPGGTGASTVAIALSQGLARSHEVVLADFRRNAELHVLHHIDSDGPGIGELVEAHRTSSPDPGTLAQLPTAVRRGYRVLAGLRRAVGWSSLRPRALAAALHGLRTAYDVVVCDIDPDLEGEAEGGSFDVEDRNALARTAVANSVAVVAVGGPGAKGTHALLRVLGELWSHGVAPEQTVAVMNRGDSDAVARLGAALGRLAAQEAATLCLPDLDLEPLLLAAAPLPGRFVDPLTAAVLPLLSMSSTRSTGLPERITPGSLGVRQRGGKE